MSDWARPVVHWAITARDPQKQRAFYAELFNWTIEPDGLMSIAAGIGGPEPGPAGHIQQGATPGISLYVQVRDIGASLVKLVELGGTKLSDPIDVEGGPTIAFAQDPEGNGLTLVQQ